MKKIFTAICAFFKEIFGQDINVSVRNDTKYCFKKNKKCNISINDGGDNNEEK